MKKSTRNTLAYLVSNGGQSPRSNGFYVRRTTIENEYEAGVAKGNKLWRMFIYLKPDMDVHFVFTWREVVGMQIYIDGLLAGYQPETIDRVYRSHRNDSGDPFPHFVANGDSLNFEQLFDQNTYLPAQDFSETGHVVNVTYFHEWMSEDQIGRMTFGYNERLVAGCFFEIPFGAELVSMLSNYSIIERKSPIKMAYFKCRNDCVRKNNPSEPWKTWMAIVDPRSLNCFCAYSDGYDENIEQESCQNGAKHTKAQITSIALLPPTATATEVIDANVKVIGQQEEHYSKFSLIVPSIKCYFVINGYFPSYSNAADACKRRGAKLAVLKNKTDENFAINQLGKFSTDKKFK